MVVQSSNVVKDPFRLLGRGEVEDEELGPEKYLHLIAIGALMTH